MKDTHVFRGPTFRVQLVVFDFTTPDTPPAVKGDRPKFCVRALPNTANMYCAFSRGNQLYYGDDPDTAWDTMKRHVPNLLTLVPRRLREYMVRWGKP
jgi:hypothetical protein